MRHVHRRQHRRVGFRGIAQALRALPVQLDLLDIARAGAPRLHHHPLRRLRVDQPDADQVGLDHVPKAADRIGRHLGQVDRVENRAVDPRHGAHRADLGPQPVRHLVERTGELAELVLAVDAELGAKVPISDPLGAEQQFADALAQPLRLAGRHRQHQQQPSAGDHNRRQPELPHGRQREVSRLHGENGPVVAGQVRTGLHRPGAGAHRFAVDRPLQSAMGAATRLRQRRLADRARGTVDLAAASHDAKRGHARDLVGAAPQVVGADRGGQIACGGRGARDWHHQRHGRARPGGCQHDRTAPQQCVALGIGQCVDPDLLGGGVTGSLDNEASCVQLCQRDHIAMMGGQRAVPANLRQRGATCQLRLGGRDQFVDAPQALDDAAGNVAGAERKLSVALCADGTRHLQIGQHREQRDRRERGHDEHAEEAAPEGAVAQHARGQELHRIS